MSLTRFHPIVQQWFRGRFEAPTEAQVQGWRAIDKGRHTLIAAPTGSGKTLAAFLTCIDRLVRAGLDGGLPETTQVVYVSPLKALSNDIQRNLATPLEEIAALAERAGTPLPEIRTAVRTGDTKPSERQKMTKHPPHILITTPESLYILLTSQGGRRGLKAVETLILDEIHAVADDKRGSHLSLSVERLCALSERPITRIGLSATQRPMEEIARLLVGSGDVLSNGAANCSIVDAGHARTIDLAIELPSAELGPIATHEMWAETLDRVADLVRDHGTTLVFVNTRRLVERVSHQLSQRLGEDAVAAHHGSLSRVSRFAAEEKLKKGDVKVCVATASLELGIDIGVVDLACQIGSPRSIGLLLQRIGRSGHSVGGTPKGRLFPLTRDELFECSALTRAVKRGNLDILKIPAWPLDILAQQIVAACSVEEWDEEELFDLCRKAYPYAELPRHKYDQVVEMLSSGFATRLGRRGALVHRDGVNHKLRARRGAGIAALTSGGAIPENADYDVVVDPDGTFVGRVNEDFAIESMAGDVFLLGNTPWKITRVESGRVRVQDAHGLAPTIPFWLGEAPGRTWELSQEVTDLREGLDRRLQDPQQARDWAMREAGVSALAAQQLVDYLLEGKRVLGMVPTGNRVIAERFFDESGGMQLVIHAPFGAAINRAWGMALRKLICRAFDFELQASATDDGLNFSLGPSLSFPLSDVFTYVKSRTADEVLLQAVLQVPMFGTRWRWVAGRALAVLRYTGGRKVPPPIQRMRSEDLLAAVFPAQVQCQDNADPGDLEVPDHPLVEETIRDCLTEAMDLEGLKRVLADIESGRIEVFAKDTVQPSVFAHQILNAMPYAFLDDAPLEERRARAVSLRRALPEDARDLGSLSPEVIATESENAWPRVRDADELHDALMILGAVPEGGRESPASSLWPDETPGWFEELVDGGRAYRLRPPAGRVAWVATEMASLALTAFPDAALDPEPPTPLTPKPDLPPEEAALELVRGWVECSGPLSADRLAGTLGLSASDVTYALNRLEGEGVVLRGHFLPGTTGDEFCDRRILARIHRATIAGLRKRVEPVSQSTFLRFLFEWQHAHPASRVSGEGGLLEVVELLQGFEAATGAWESDLLPARISDYRSLTLDRMCLEGEVVWGRMARPHSNGHQQPNRVAMTRTTPISLAARESLAWLQDPGPDDDHLTGAAREVLDFLRHRGASFLPDIIAGTRRLPSEVEAGLWQLAFLGLVSADSFEAIRQLTRDDSIRRRVNGRRGRRRPYQRPRYSRWSVLQAVDPEADQVEPRARQLLRRYGVLFPELLAREPMAPPWRELVRLLRRLEARGEVHGGRFVAGFVGEQFAALEAVDALRSIKDREPGRELLAISACDPLNLAGIATPGERVPAVIGNRVVFRDGVPICSLESGSIVVRAHGEPHLVEEATELLRPKRPRAKSGRAAGVLVG